MISVDNFYWVLYQTLLSPVGLDCWYYYPWGTKQNLSRYEYKTWDRVSDNHHVLFHFDQEPIWDQNLGPGYDQTFDANRPWKTSVWSHGRFAKVLANSETSDIKQKLCRDRDMLDWYFFYHAFAALDWYRDAQYVEHQHQIRDAFLSLNHVLHRRPYRLALLCRMINQDIAHRGRISFRATSSAVAAELCDPFTHLSDTSRHMIQHALPTLADLPWQLDDVAVNGHLSARFGHKEYALWQQSLWHVVNETVFYEPKLHLTEKTFKPIVSQRPFVLVAAPGNLAYLRSYGFLTFDRWIDESYDVMQDADQRLDAIVAEITRFAHMSVKELRDIHQDMQSVLQHNKQHFFGAFRDIIVSELVNNFDQCIRLWNNGRVDGRELPLHADLESVKRIMMQ